MRILCIGGFWRKEHPILNALETASGSVFPKAEFVIEHEEMLHPHQVTRIRHFADRLVRQYDDGEELLLMGHSFGGIIVRSIEQRFENSKVVGMSTIFSPHGIPFWYALPLPEPSNPLVTFGGMYDWLVPYWFTQHPRAVGNVLMPTDHWHDVATNPLHALQIVIETKHYLFLKNLKT